ncbi:hypothetical protein VCV18_005517 [Metarhizium anisopliae]
MARLPPHLRLLLLAGVVSSKPTPALFARDTCAASGRASCTSQGLSEGLCCPTSSNCVPLAGNTTVICCPSDSSCTKIQPITCDISEQDPTLHPDAPIKTTAHGAKLPTCGSNFCCPFGYTCSADSSSCTKDSDQSKAPPGTTPTLTPTAKPEATSPSTSTGQAAAATSTSASQEDNPSPLGAEKISIIGGAVGGGLALILLVGIIFLCVRSRSRKSPKSPPFREISPPILNNQAGRVDFIRKEEHTPPPPKGPSFIDRCSRFLGLPERQTQNAHSGIPNRFYSPNPSLQSSRLSRSSLTSEDDRNARTGHVGARLPPIRQMRGTHTQSRRISTLDTYDEPSRESINVFADPDTVSNDGHRNHRGTTFSDLMDQADMSGVHRNGGYVPGSQRLRVPGATPNL